MLNISTEVVMNRKATEAGVQKVRSFEALLAGF
jgi:hypothetical protein